MRKKINWTQVLVETIGLPTLLSIVIGVPAMITFIRAIWEGLSPRGQIIAIVSITLISLAIGLFIYGQARKILYGIPKILHQMHLRTIQLASHLSITTLPKEDFVSFMSLVNIDSKEIFASIADLNSLLSSVPKLVEIAETQSGKVKTEKETPLRIFYFMYEKIGLKEALETDKLYKQLKQKLSRIQSLVPTVEMSQAILEYDMKSRIIGTFLPMFETIPDEMFQILPLPYKIDRIRKVEELNNQMATQLARVRECIDKYYKEK
jgi:hypothetical protein